MEKDQAGQIMVWATYSPENFHVPVVLPMMLILIQWLQGWL
jgi:hypothetical protein